MAESGYSVVKYVFPNGELSKNISTFSDILEYLAENDFKHNDTLIALGGGVVGDITEFAASVYMYGIEFIQIPTTLLAAVDASVGGKTLVDLNAGKISLVHSGSQVLLSVTARLLVIYLVMF